MTDAPGRNLAGGAWLIADMALNIWALSIVKALGLDYPPVQIVFLRAAVGLAIMAPFAWHRRAAFRSPGNLRLQALRIGLSTLTLTASFFAIARVPLALFTAINFTRPLMLMALAALFLGERIGPRRWLAACAGLIGVAIAVNPGGAALNWGIAALFVVVLTGTGAVIVTRKLNAVPKLVMMSFYTGGLAVLSAPFALIAWQPVAAAHLWPLLAIGAFAQSAQLCFLQAHRLGEAGFLAVLGYLSLIVSTTVGYVVFDEWPDWRFWIGAALITGAALWVTAERRR